MTFGATGISDLSDNKYAAAMRELAEGLSGWSGLLLLPFVIYQVIVHKAASLFSIKSFFLNSRLKSAYLSSKENFGGLGRMVSVLQPATTAFLISASSHGRIL